jgi:hypothetical protein
MKVDDEFERFSKSIYIKGKWGKLRFENKAFPIFQKLNRDFIGICDELFD